MKGKNILAILLIATMLFILPVMIANAQDTGKKVKVLVRVYHRYAQTEDWHMYGRLRFDLQDKTEGTGECGTDKRKFKVQVTPTIDSEGDAITVILTRSGIRSNIG